MIQQFSEANLPPKLLQTLEKLNFTAPTPVQAEAIPHALEGRDILGSAQTGTGKTGAFGIPLVAKLMTNPRGGALVITPTRELALQVLQQLQLFLGKPSPIRTALLIGGDSMPAQIKQIRMRPRIIVGTPGRINDHLERGNLMLADTNYLVLDETDRMLDMGFSIQIEKILKFLPAQRQTLLFSATLPKNIIKLTDQYLTDPVRVAVGDQSAPAQNIKHETMHVNDNEKYDTLLEQLDKRDGSVIIFVKTKRGADQMAGKLRRSKHSAEAVHGDLHQSKRDRVIKGFRNRKHRILVATDIAARGLDIPHIEHVINYDLPQCPEDYIHRIGRTARAGADGEAISLIAPIDKLKWKAIHKMMNPDAKPAGEGKPGGVKKKSGGGNKSRYRGKPRSGKPGGAPKKDGGGAKGAFDGAPRKKRAPRPQKAAGA